MLRTDCFGRTRLALHVPSSLRAENRHYYGYIIVARTLHTGRPMSYCLLPVGSSRRGLLQAAALERSRAGPRRGEPTCHDSWRGHAELVLLAGRLEAASGSVWQQQPSRHPGHCH